MQYSLTPFNNAGAVSAGVPDDIAWLIAQGIVTFDAAADAAELAKLIKVTTFDVLKAEHGLSEQHIIAAKAATTGIKTIDPLKLPPDPALLAEFGPTIALHRDLLPWRKIGTETIILTAKPEDFHDDIPALEATFGPVRMGLATVDQIQTAISNHFGEHIAHRAATRLSKNICARDWRTDKAGTIFFLALAIILAGLIWNAPATFGAITAFALVVLGLQTLLFSASAITGAFTKPNRFSKPTAVNNLPIITLLIPLLNERNIADHLLKRLRDLDYPRALLDVCLILEDGDTTTLDTIRKAVLPDWARIIVVPNAGIRTKPKALNYALNTAKGSIIGVYDAEDAPGKSQLLVVADAFAKAPSNVGCLQGVLDYYNSKSNWLTRCFTVEYAGWFRVVLPGLAKLGFTIPLGGTTIFFRREVLDKLGAWDAHNVTEDADLGIRLSRNGYKTCFIPTVTEEEANGHYWPWVKQRSRWLKGYAVTYCVHMRRPNILLNELGLWKFIGFQVLFLGTLCNFILAPVVWAFWLLPLFGVDLYTPIFPDSLIWTGILICVSSSIVNLCIVWIGLQKAGKMQLIPWYFTMVAYYPLASLAVYKGLIELVRRPFFWDKTEHGILLPEKP